MFCDLLCSTPYVQWSPGQGAQSPRQGPTGKEQRTQMEPSRASRTIIEALPSTLVDIQYGDEGGFSAIESGALRTGLTMVQAEHPRHASFTQTRRMTPPELRDAEHELPSECQARPAQLGGQVLLGRQRWLAPTVVMDLLNTSTGRSSAGHGPSRASPTAPARSVQPVPGLQLGRQRVRLEVDRSLPGPGDRPEVFDLFRMGTATTTAPRSARPTMARHAFVLRVFNIFGNVTTSVATRR